MTIMTHDDYVAQIDYDPEIGMFHGRIVNIHSVVNFYGKSVDDLKKEFETSVKVYLDVCREKRH